MSKNNKAKNYAYVTLLTTDSYYRGVVILYESLRKVESKYPLICLITEDISQEVIQILNKLSIKTILVDKISLPSTILDYNKKIDENRAAIWEFTATKFHIFDLTEYDKIIFCDADLLVLKNLDHCFELPHLTAAFDGEYVNLWPTLPHFNSGFMVIEPGKDSSSAILDFVKTHDLKSIPPNQVIADQDILNLYFADWVNDTSRHLSKYYNIFPIHVPKSCAQDILDNGYFVHFVGTKPWETMPVQEYFGTINPTYKSPFAQSQEEAFCAVFYEIAYTILQMSANYNFQKLHWDSIIQSGSIDYLISVNAATFFADLDNANIYINKALAKNSDSIQFINFKQEIENLFKIKRYCKLFLDLLTFAYSEYPNGQNSMNYYFTLKALQTWYSSSAYLVCTDLINCLPEVISDSVLTKLFK